MDKINIELIRYCRECKLEPGHILSRTARQIIAYNAGMDVSEWRQVPERWGG